MHLKQKNRCLLYGLLAPHIASPTNHTVMTKPTGTELAKQQSWESVKGSNVGDRFVHLKHRMMGDDGLLSVTCEFNHIHSISGKLAIISFHGVHNF